MFNHSRGEHDTAEPCFVRCGWYCKTGDIPVKQRERLSGVAPEGRYGFRSSRPVGRPPIVWEPNIWLVICSELLLLYHELRLEEDGSILSGCVQNKNPHCFVRHCEAIFRRPKRCQNYVSGECRFELYALFVF